MDSAKVSYGGNAESAADFIILQGPRYWVGGTGSKDFADTANWSTTSGGAGGASVPSTTGNAIFDGNSFSGNGTLSLTSCTTYPLASLSFTGVTETITIETDASPVFNLFGSFAMPSNVRFTNTNTNFIVLSGTGVTPHTINVGGTNPNIYIESGVGANYVFAADYSDTGGISGNGSINIYEDGTFDTANYDISAASINIGNATVSLGSSTVTATVSLAMYNGGALVIPANTATLALVSTASAAELQLQADVLISNLVVNCTNTVNLNAINTPAQQFGTITFGPSQTILPYSGSHLEATDWVFNGTAGNEVIMSVYGANDAQTYTFTTTNNVVADYLNVRNSIVDGAGTWTYGTGTTNNGFNTGWITLSPTYTRTHTTNALKRKAITLTHTTSSNKKLATTKAHTTSANKKVSGIVRTHTTSANKKTANLTRTHTTNALKRKATTVTHTTSSNKKKATTVSHTTSSYITKPNFTRTHTADALKTTGTTQVTNTYYVAASADDAWENISGTVVINGTGNGTGEKFDRDNHLGFRFPNVTIAQGTTITAAYFRLPQLQNYSGFSNMLGQVHMQNSDTAAQFTTTTDDISSRARTTAFVNNPGADTDPWTVGNTNKGLDITSLVQEVLNRGGWSSGNAMAALLIGDETGATTQFISPYMWDYFTGTYAAELRIVTTTVSAREFGIGHGTDAFKSTRRSHTTDAHTRTGVSTYTRTHTTDALKRKATTVSHTTNALIRKTNTLSHTTSSNKKKASNVVSHTTSANKKTASLTRTHTTNANKRVTGLTRTHTTNALLRSQNTRTHTTNSLKRTLNTRTHTTNAFIRKANTVSYTTSANKRVTGITRTHTTSANKRITGNTRSHTTDILKRSLNTRTHTTDTLKRKFFTLTHTTNAFLRGQLTRTHTTNANKKVANNLRTHTTNALKRLRTIASHTTDARPYKPQFSDLIDDFDDNSIDSAKWSSANNYSESSGKANFYADGVGGFSELRSTQYMTLIGNSIFWKYGPDYISSNASTLVDLRNSSNVHIMRLEHLVSGTVNVVNASYSVVASVTYNATTTAWWRYRESSGTFYVEYATTPTGSWTTLYSVSNPSGITSAKFVATGATFGNSSDYGSGWIDNVNVSTAQYSITHTTDALKRKAATLSHTTNSALRQARTVSHTTNALIRKTNTLSHTANSNLRKVSTFSHTTSANKRKANLTVSHTTSANKRVAGNLVSHTTNTLKRTATTRTHTTNALLRSLNTRSHTTSSFLKRQVTLTHTTSANKRKTDLTISHTTSANKRKATTVSHTTSSNKRRASVVSHTTNALKRLPTEIYHTTDSYIRPIPQVQVHVGSYLGNGVSYRMIDELGFEPMAVFVKGAGSQVWSLWTNTMGSDTKQMTGSVAPFADGIIGTFGDGFYINTDSRVNSNGVTYHFAAIHDPDGWSFWPAQYTGDATTPRDITGNIFQPDLVVMAPKSADTPGFRTKDMPTNSFYRPESFGNLTNRILSLNPDGFTIGSTNEVNKDVTDYDFFAMQDTSGVLKTLSYTGNATDNRSVTGVGFQPDFTLVRNGSEAQVAAIRFKDEVGDNSMLVNGAETSNHIQAFESDGFQIGTSDNVNKNTQTFYTWNFKHNAYGIYRYWVGNSGSWNETEHWSTTSGGPGGAPAPTQYTHVIFDENSFSSSGHTVDATSYPIDVKSFDSRDVIYPFSLPSASNTTVHGNVYFSPDMSITGHGLTVYPEFAGTYDIDTQGAVFDLDITIGGSAAGIIFNVLSDLTQYATGISVSFSHVIGTFNLNGHNLDVNNVYITSDTDEFNIGGGTITVRDRDFHVYGGTWTSNVGTIMMELEDREGSLGTSSVELAIPIEIESFIVGSTVVPLLFTMGDITTTTGMSFAAGSVIEMNPGSTYTSADFQFQGTSGNEVVITSLTPTSEYYFVQTSGTVTGSYLEITDNHASGGALFLRGTGFVDGGNVVGWAQSFSKYHTTNALKRKQSVISHTTDANKRKVATLTHTTDANKRKVFTLSHTANALLRKATTLTHTTNAFKRTQNTLVHTTNSFVRKANTVSHTTNANKRVTGTLVSHTTSANKRRVSTVFHTTNALKRTLTSITHTTSAFLRRRVEASHTTNSFLRSGNSIVHTTNANKKRGYGVAHTADSNKKKIDNLLTHTTSSVKRKQFAVSHTTNALKRTVIALTHTTNTLLRSLNTRTHTTNSNLRKATTALHTTSSNRRKATVVLHTADANKRIAGNLRTHTTDTLKRRSLTLTHTTNSFLRLRVTVQHTTNALIRKATSVVHTTDAYLRGANSVDHSTDANKRLQGNIVSHTTSANKRIAGNTVSHTTNSFLRKANAVSHTTNSLLRKTNIVSHATDTLKRTATAISHTTNSFLRRRVTVSHTTSANKKLQNNTVLHTTSAFLRGANQVTHNTDTNKRKSATIFHTTDASKKIVYTLSHTVNSLLRSVKLVSHTTSSNRRKANAVSHLTDALKRKANIVSHTTSTNKRAPTSVSHTTNALLRSIRTLNHSTNSFLRKAYSVTHTTSANKKRAIAIVHTTNAFLRGANQSFHVTDANKKRQNNTISHTTDIVKRKLVSVSHTTNTLLRRAVSLSHTTSAFLRRINVVSHTTSANRRKAQIAAHTTDALIREASVLSHTTSSSLKQRYSISHTTDILLRSVDIASHTTSANKKTSQSVSHSTDSVLAGAIGVAHTTDANLYTLRGNKKILVNGVWIHGIVKILDNGDWRIVPVKFYNGSIWIETWL